MSKEDKKREVKELIIKTLDLRGCCTDRELLSLPEVGLLRNLYGVQPSDLLDEIVDSGDVVAVDFTHEDRSDARTVYFPLGTTVYEPGWRVKRYTLPDNVERGFATFKREGVLNDDMLEGLSRAAKIRYYEAIHKHVQQGGKLATVDMERILKTVSDENYSC